MERFDGCRAAATVVMAAEGYPTNPTKGARVDGLEAASAIPDVVVFHAGTCVGESGTEVAGGRVLGVTACADDPASAIARAYRAVAEISWEGVQFRRDIGKAL